MILIKRLMGSLLIRGSILVFIGSNTVSFGNFIYNIFMGRMLEPSAYGDLGAIFSLISVVSVPFTVLQTGIIKTVSAYYGRGDVARIRGFLAYAAPKFIVLGMAACTFIYLFRYPISGFLKLDSESYAILMGTYFLLSLPLLLNKSVLSGSLAFKYLSINGIFEMLIKLLLSVILVMMNFGLFGALVGPVAGMLAGILVSQIEIYSLFKTPKQAGLYFNPRKVVRKLLPFFLITFALISMINSDILVIKHFFDAKTAGEYTALSTTGKIIFYMAGPVISVMFPLISSKAEKGHAYILPLLGTLTLSLVMSLCMVFLYFLIPGTIVNVIFGTKYMSVIPLMGQFAFFMSIYTVNSALSYFLLSVSYFKPIYFLFTVSLLHIILMLFFHDTIRQVIHINIFISLVFLLTVGFFVLKREKGILGLK